MRCCGMVIYPHPVAFCGTMVILLSMANGMTLMLPESCLLLPVLRWRFVARDSEEHKLYCAYHKRKATIDFAGIQEQMRAIELVTPDKTHLDYFRYVSNEDIKYILAHDAMETAWYLCTHGFSSRNIQAAIEGGVDHLDRWYERHFQLGKYGYNTPNYRAKCDLV